MARRNSNTVTAKRRRWVPIAWVLALLLIAAACGDDDTPAPAPPQTVIVEVPGETVIVTETVTVTSIVTKTEIVAVEVTAPPPPVEPDHVTLRLDWVTYGLHAMFYVGEVKGFYADENIDIDILQGNGSSNTVILVGNGNDTFGFADTTTTVRAIGEGIPLKMIGVIAQAPGVTLSSVDEPCIESPQDLVGRSIGVGVGEAITQILPALYAANDIDPDSVDLVTMAGTARTGALLGGAVDAIGGSIYGDALGMRFANPDRTFCYLRFANYGVALMGHGLIATRDTLENKPDVVRRFLAATQRGIEYTRDNPQEATEILTGLFPETADQSEFFQAALEIVLNDHLHTEASADLPTLATALDDWNSMLSLLSDYAGLDRKLPPDVYYTNDFLPAN